jgi:hypothetical protein
MYGSDHEYNDVWYVTPCSLVARRQCFDGRLMGNLLYIDQTARCRIPDGFTSKSKVV